MLLTTVALGGTDGPEPVDPDPDKPEPDPELPDPDEPEPDEPEPEPVPELPEPDPKPDEVDWEPVDVTPVFTTLAEQADKQKRVRLTNPKRNCERRSFMDFPLLNRPVLTSIVRGGRLASVKFDLYARTLHLPARMRRSGCRFGRARQYGYGNLAAVFVSHQTPS